MLSVFAALALASSVSVQDPATARAAAAAELRSALEHARGDGHGPAERLAVLVAAARAAGERLLGTRTADELEAATREALSSASAPEASAQLRGELERAAEDLAFEVLVEAPVPEGFPAPTPVREIELKRYPVYRMARAPMSRAAFWQLFTHIERREIAMTAPVETTWRADEGALDEAEMAFLYRTPELGPLGAAGPVEVVDAEPTWVASLGCRGNTTRAAVADARAALERWLASRPELEVAGPLRVMGYNSPMVPARRRYFEVQLPVRRTGVEEGAMTDTILIDFAEPAEAARWRAVDDVVMGGVSASRFASQDGACVFEGRVSLENDGGFASVRSDRRRLDLAGASALVLSCKGDGKRYVLRLRTSGAFDDVSYQASFATEAGAWSEHVLPLESFVPTWRGRVVRDAPPLDPAAVQGVGLLISDAQQGPFRLELARLARR